MGKDIIFIDTNVFISEHYFLKKNRITTLCNLAAKSRINILMPEIIKEEIAHHIQTDMRHAFNAVTDKENCVLKHDKKYDQYCYTSSKKEMDKIASTSLETFLTHSNTYILGYDYCTDVNIIFAKYFGKEKPFGEGKKKDEFPDAFALLALETYCKKNKLPQIIVLSQDSDMKKYNSPYLKVIEYKAYVSQKLAEDTELTSLESQLESMIPLWTKDWEDDIIKTLDDESLYTPICGFSDISDIDITACEVSANPSQYYIIENTEEFLSVEIYPTVEFQVKVRHQDLDYGYYDSEDHCWYGDVWSTKDIKSSANIKVTLNFQKESSYLDIEDVDLEEVLHRLE